MYCLDFFLRTFGLVGYDAPFTRERTRVRFAQGVIIINIPLRIKIKIYYNINIYMSTYTEVSIKNKVELNTALFQSNINTSKWGKGEAKSVDDLLKEIMAGETLLLKDGNNKLVRIVSAVWVKMIFNINASNKAKLLPPSALADDSALGNYYLIETCNYSQTGPIPFVDIQFKKESKIHSRYLTENMVLPNYKGKPLAGKQTKEDTKEADIRSGAIETALREIKEELNITLPYKGKNDPFDPDIFVEWYPKVIKGGSKCESKVGEGRKACYENSLKKQKDTISKDAKLVTWEWIKESPDAIKANSIEQIPDITLAKSSNSYPGLGTLYKIIHLRTKNLEEFDWGKQWINASEGKDAHRPKKLNEKVESQEIIQYYPPPYQPWQEEEGITTPLCFNVYENPKAAPTAATVVPLKHQETKKEENDQNTKWSPSIIFGSPSASSTSSATSATKTATTKTATKAAPAAAKTTKTATTKTSAAPPATKTTTSAAPPATKGGNKRKQKKTRNKKGKKKKGTRRRKRKKRTKN